MFIEQFFGGLCDQLRALALPAFEKQKTLGEDEAIKQKRLRIGLFGRKAGRAIKLPDILEPRGGNT